MGDAYLSEIRIFGGTFAPQHWALCDGSLLPISENEKLHQLIGTTYGGDGQDTFALPDLRGRVPVHMGGAYGIGASGGEETVTLSTDQLPKHAHVPRVTNQFGQQSLPKGLVPGRTVSSDAYGSDADAAVPMSPDSYSSVGGEPHENRQPFVAMTYIICVDGAFPSKN